MLAIRTILHPTDFSERSHDAFQLACSLARDHGARLVLLHVNRPDPVLVGPEGLVLPLPGDYQEDLVKCLYRLSPSDPQVPVEHYLKEGDPATEILALARKLPCDLIVMATHGRSGLTRLLMGSVAEQVARRAPCPVLTVRTPLPQAESWEEKASEKLAPAMETAEP